MICQVCRMQIGMESDPNPFPYFKLFRWLPRHRRTYSEIMRNETVR